MNAFMLSAAAKRDINEIWDYILEDAGVLRADSVSDAIYDGIHRIAAYPKIGHRHAHLRDQTLRVWTVYPYLIVYWPDQSPLPISRVIHGARDLIGIDTPPA